MDENIQSSSMQLAPEWPITLAANPNAICYAHCYQGDGSSMVGRGQLHQAADPHNSLRNCGAQPSSEGGAARQRTKENENETARDKYRDRSESSHSSKSPDAQCYGRSVLCSLLLGERNLRSA